MNQPLLLAAVLIATMSTPALAKGASPCASDNTRLVRICNERGACQRVAQEQVCNALRSVGGPLTASPEATASAASNRRQLNALLAKLR